MVPTGLPSTVPPPTPAPTSTVAASTTSSTSSTTTTSVPKAAKLVVAADGLGDALFGAEPEQVISYVTAVIGPPSDDSGWIDANTDFPACPGNELRIVRWDDLRLLFSRVAVRHRPPALLLVRGRSDGRNGESAVRCAHRRAHRRRQHGRRAALHVSRDELWVDPVRGPLFLVNGVPGGVEGTATDLGDDQFVTMVMAGPCCDGDRSRADSHSDGRPAAARPVPDGPLDPGRRLRDGRCVGGRGASGDIAALSGRCGCSRSWPTWWSPPTW